MVKKRQRNPFGFGQVKECIDLQMLQTVKRVWYISERYRITRRFRGLHWIDVT